MAFVLSKHHVEVFIPWNFFVILLCMYVHTKIITEIYFREKVNFYCKTNAAVLQDKKHINSKLYFQRL